MILQAVLSNNPDFRYAVGKDAVMMLEARRICLIENFKTYPRNSLSAEY